MKMKMMAGMVMVMVMVMVMMMMCMAVSETALTCGYVASAMGPCISYLKSEGGSLPPACCNGVRTVHSHASTPTDRRTACFCLKNVAAVISTGINYYLAAALPGKCGVTIPYKFSPTLDCSKVI